VGNVPNKPCWGVERVADRGQSAIGRKRLREFRSACIADPDADERKLHRAAEQTMQHLPSTITKCLDHDHASVQCSARITDGGQSAVGRKCCRKLRSTRVADTVAEKELHQTGE